jgi:hypothetical protein
VKKLPIALAVVSALATAQEREGPRDLAYPPEGVGPDVVGVAAVPNPPTCKCFDVDAMLASYNGCTAGQTFECFIDENGYSYATVTCTNPWGAPLSDYTVTEPQSCARDDYFEGTESRSNLNNKKMDECRDTIVWAGDDLGSPCAEPPPAPDFVDDSGGWTDTPVPQVVAEGTPFSIYYELFVGTDYYQSGANTRVKVFDAGDTLRQFWYHSASLYYIHQFQSGFVGGVSRFDDNPVEEQFAEYFYSAHYSVYDGSASTSFMGAYAGSGFFPRIGYRTTTTCFGPICPDSQYPDPVVGGSVTGASWPWQTGYTWQHLECDPDCGTGCGAYPGCGNATAGRFYLWFDYELSEAQAEWLAAGGDPVP